MFTRGRAGGRVSTFRQKMSDSQLQELAEGDEKEEVAAELARLERLEQETAECKAALLLLLQNKNNSNKREKQKQPGDNADPVLLAGASPSPAKSEWREWCVCVRERRTGAVVVHNLLTCCSCYCCYCYL